MEIHKWVLITTRVPYYIKDNVALLFWSLDICHAALFFYLFFKNFYTIFQMNFQSIWVDVTGYVFFSFFVLKKTCSGFPLSSWKKEKKCIGNIRILRAMHEVVVKSRFCCRSSYNRLAKESDKIKQEILEQIYHKKGL